MADLRQEALKLGLSHHQVSIKNFSWSTFYAIKAELSKEDPLSLYTAFTKYRGLSEGRVFGFRDKLASEEKALITGATLSVERDMLLHDGSLKTLGECEIIGVSDDEEYGL